MYPNKGRLLRESAVRDGGVVRGGYSNASEGSLWGPEKERLGRSGCLGRVCWQRSTRRPRGCRSGCSLLDITAGAMELWSILFNHHLHWGHEPAVADPAGCSSYGARHATCTDKAPRERSYGAMEQFIQSPPSSELELESFYSITTFIGDISPPPQIRRFDGSALAEKRARLVSAFIRRV